MREVPFVHAFDRSEEPLGRADRVVEKRLAVFFRSAHPDAEYGIHRSLRAAG